MTDIPLSLAEKTYILHGVDANFRNDGRERCQYRWMEIETKVIDSVNGCAKVKAEDTIVIVGTKLELDSPYPDHPFEGKLEFFVDCSPNATRDIEGKGGDDFASEISEILKMAYSSSEALDLKLLSIIPHKKCWNLYVDVLILQIGGNLLDAVAVAVKAALYTTEIPKVRAAALDGGEPDIQLSDDVYDCFKLDVTNFPLFVTLCKIGDNYVVDATLEEKTCTSASLTLSVMPNGKITSLVKMDYGSLQPATLCKMIKMGTEVGLILNQHLMDALNREDKLGHKRHIFGLL